MNTRNRMSLFTVAAIIFTGLCSCVPQPLSTASRQATPRPVKVTVQGEGLGKEQIQTIALDNCSGKSDLTRVERRSQSVDVTVSEEMAARLGASVEVISAEVQSSVGEAMTQKGERSSEIHLTAPLVPTWFFKWCGAVQNSWDTWRTSLAPVPLLPFVASHPKMYASKASLILAAKMVEPSDHWSREISVPSLS